MRIMTLLIFFLCSCSNELVLLDEQKDIPIVYCLIDLTDTIQLIRLEKAFADPIINPLELAMDPDNFYYQDAKVKMIRDDVVFEFDQINGDDIGLPRREGLFATAPNLLYAKESNQMGLKSEDLWELQIERFENAPLLSANIELVKPAKFPSIPSVLDFDFEEPLEIRWFASSNSAIYTLSFIFHYEEWDRDSGLGYVPKSIEWTAKNSTERLFANVIGHKFYNHLRENMVASSRILRKSIGLELKLLSGGPEIRSYVKIGQANVGITSSQVIPTYSNLSEGYGVFSSRTSTVVGGLELSPESQDTLMRGQITKKLNFLK